MTPLSNRKEPEKMTVINEAEAANLPITIDPEILSGAPVFAGTRVPIESLLSNLEAGLMLDEFLENFPTVSREQAVAVLEFYDSNFAQAEERFARWIGAVSGGDPNSANNERMDADLAREYGATHE
jgi:uncharacterized protein (DUF433 family)